MSEPLLLKPTGMDESEIEAATRELTLWLDCDQGRHVPNPLYAWRCAHCWGLLCTHCGEEIDNCHCPREVRHG